MPRYYSSLYIITLRAMETSSIFLVLVVCLLPPVQTADHLCKRDCVRDARPLTCVYNFTIEWYRTLSKACYQCPFNQTDCFRPECVSGDGVIKAIITINRQVPGPAIEVCEGDRVVVMVTNDMEDGLASSVHWHGLHQKGTPYMDGVGGITQCNIGIKETFRYEFAAKPIGTHWYHAHTGLQMADGLFGPIIIRQPLDLDPNSALYDVDDHVMMVGDWIPVTSMTRYVDLMHDRYDVFLPQGLHVNGRARNVDVFNAANIIDTTEISAKTPLTVFYVDSGKRYRFRVIGASGNCPVEVSFEQHRLTMLTADGHAVKPRPIDRFVLHPGERYDFVLDANQEIGNNYWIRVVGLGDCGVVKVKTAAILRYNGALDVDPETDFASWTSGEISFNPLHAEVNDTVVRPSQLEKPVTDVNLATERVDQQFYIGMRYLRNDNTKYNNKELYPTTSLHPKKSHNTPTFDNITFYLPPIPVLSQPEDVDESWFCNRSTLVDSDKCLDDLCLCTHTIRVNLGENIEIILIAEAIHFHQGHVVHLHGHSFYVLGSDESDGSTSRDEIMRLDAEGKLARNYINPPLRDTIMVPAGGYVILRFKANNPGYWLLHCHTDSHLAQGKALLIKTGDYSDFPKVPDSFPRCGGMGFGQTCKKEECPPIFTNGCKPHFDHSTLFTISAMVLSLLIRFSSENN